MIIDWDLKKVKSQVDKIVFAATDPKMDGFNTWGCKKDLYEILWYVEDSLDKCSSYVDEDEFVKRREQKKLLKALGKKQ
jgi:hypothetical protein